MKGQWPVEVAHYSGLYLYAWTRSQGPPHAALQSADGQGKNVKKQDKLARRHQHFKSVLNKQTTVSDVHSDKLKGCVENGGSPEGSFEVVNDGLVCSITAEEVTEAVS